MSDIRSCSTSLSLTLLCLETWSAREKACLQWHFPRRFDKLLDPEPELLGLIGCSADDVHGTKGRIDCESGNNRISTKKNHPHLGSNRKPDRGTLQHLFSKGWKEGLDDGVQDDQGTWLDEDPSIPRY